MEKLKLSRFQRENTIQKRRLSYKPNLGLLRPPSFSAKLGQKGRGLVSNAMYDNITRYNAI